MKAAGTIPFYFPPDDSGVLAIGGTPAEELVSEAGGTPLFVYDNNIVGAQVARFQAAMPSGVALNYNVCANPYQPLLEFLGRYVDGFRVVSLGELERLREADLAGLPIHFAGPGKRDDELEAAIDAGATISIESEGETSRAIAAGERLGIQPKLAVRVNVPFTIEGGQLTMGARPSPFGIDSERVPDVVAAIVEAGATWSGLHMFAGAQSLNAGAIAAAHRATIDSAGEIGARIGRHIPELNLGSGFDIACHGGEEPLDIDHVANELCETLRHAPDALATTRISLELGRWLVGEAGVYLTRVLDRTTSCGRTFLTVDGGGHHLLGATGCLGERGRGNYPIALANRFGAAGEEDVIVTGCLCTPFDVLGDEVSLPRAEPGDLIAIFCAGAYGLTASPQAWESRPPARELLV
ncbi:MAG: pyridoxal-dependent decarboxylase, exosortase A system-associated [Sphingomicrobium sp.]